MLGIMQNPMSQNSYHLTPRLAMGFAEVPIGDQDRDESRASPSFENRIHDSFHERTQAKPDHRWPGHKTTNPASTLKLYSTSHRQLNNKIGPNLPVQSQPLTKRPKRPSFSTTRHNGLRALEAGTSLQVH